MKKSKASGDSWHGKRKLMFLWSICRFWTQGVAKTWWVLSLQILCCKCCPLWHRMNGKISESVRHRALPPQKPTEWSSEDLSKRLRPIFWRSWRNGKVVLSNPMKPPRCAECVNQPFTIDCGNTEQHWTAKKNHCKKVHLNTKAIKVAAGEC